MNFTLDEIADIQTALDALHERQQREYTALVTMNSPLLMWVAKPERITFWGQRSQFAKAQGTNIRPHYGKRR